MRKLRRANARISGMIWKRIKQASPPSDQTWKQIDQTPIPLSSGRIWLADKDGNVTRALGWTWRILKRREPRKYRWWISRANHAREPCGKWWKGPAPSVSSDQQAIQPSEASARSELLRRWRKSRLPTANQIAFWQALALSGSRQPIVGYGRIFGLKLPVSQFSETVGIPGGGRG